MPVYTMVCPSCKARVPFDPERAEAGDIPTEDMAGLLQQCPTCGEDLPERLREQQRRWMSSQKRRDENKAVRGAAVGCGVLLLLVLVVWLSFVFGPKP